MTPVLIQCDLQRQWLSPYTSLKCLVYLVLFTAQLWSEFHSRQRLEHSNATKIPSGLQIPYVAVHCSQFYQNAEMQLL
jgi:hypothetical protein